MLNKAIEGFNSITSRNIVGIDDDMEAIRIYLSDQSVRHVNKINGQEYLNCEMDVVARLKTALTK